MGHIPKRVCVFFRPGKGDDMTDREYAMCIYYNVFGYSADPCDANIRGIEAVLKKLTERERVTLESHLRHEKTMKCVAQDIKASIPTAKKAVDSALNRMRHTVLRKRMRISLLEEELESYRQKYNDTIATIEELKAQAGLVAYRMPVNEDFKAAFAKFNISIQEIDFPPSVKNALLRARKDTVESVLSIGTFEKLIEIPRIGPKMAISVITTMRDLGFREWSENMIAEAAQYDASLIAGIKDK
jgi:DNA-binding FrmR family transcriptional regulator